jgi:hypothetical protein
MTASGGEYLDGDQAFIRKLAADHYLTLNLVNKIIDMMGNSCTISTAGGRMDMRATEAGKPSWEFQGYMGTQERMDPSATAAVTMLLGNVGDDTGLYSLSIGNTPVFTVDKERNIVMTGKTVKIITDDELTIGVGGKMTVEATSSMTLETTGALKVGSTGGMATFGGATTYIVGTAVILPGLGLGGSPYTTGVYTVNVPPIDCTLSVNIKVDSGKGLLGQGQLVLAGSSIAFKAP